MNVWTAGWRTVVTIVLIMDYFLFATGNPSLTYSAFGGWFLIPLVVATVIAGMYAVAAVGNPAKRRGFVVYLGTVAAVSAMLFAISGAAHRHAETVLVAYASDFAHDPSTSTVRANAATRALMAEIARGPHTLREDGFIPTFRRGDFNITTGPDRKYTMILVMSWDGTPCITIGSEGS
jgi:hypothetical protein